MAVPMTPEKFENIAGTISYTFSLKQKESQFEQPLVTPLSIGVGADYGHDHLGYGGAPAGLGTIGIRTLLTAATPALIETAMSEAAAECKRIGLGYLYRLSADGSTRRRCLARLTDMPSVTVNGNSQFSQPILFRFRRQSDWMATTATAGSQTITADPTLVTVTNAGDLPVKTGIVMTLTALAASGFVNPSIFNATTGERVSTTRDSNVIGSAWKVGDPDYAVGYQLAPSLVIGQSGRHIGAAAVGPAYSRNDYSLVTLTKGFLTLNPGANALYIFGVSNATFSYSFYGSYV